METRNYVNNKKLFEAIVAWKESNLSLREFKDGDYIGSCILSICQGLGKLRNFSGYSYIDDMIDEAVCHVCRYLNRFDPEISENPFSYITQIAYFSFQSSIKKEKRQREIKLRAMSDSVVLNQILSDMGATNEIQPIIETIQQMLQDADQIKPIEKRKVSVRNFNPNTALSNMMEGRV